MIIYRNEIALLYIVLILKLIENGEFPIKPGVLKAKKRVHYVFFCRCL